MDTDKLLYSYLTDGIRRNHHHRVGVELEYPLVAINGGEIDLAVVPAIFSALEPLGFHIKRRAADGSPLAAEDASGHTFTFDTCYENVEFASAPALTFWPIYERFHAALEAVQSALSPLGCALLGIGHNPLLTHPHMIESELTLAIAEYLKEHQKPHRASKDFYCMVSSEQVHFNTAPAELPRLMEAFTRLDWLNILLFSDSPAQVEGERYLCARNELYMRSSLAPLGLVGAFPLGLRSAEEIARSYGELGLFMRRRGGRLEVFDPEPVRAYFQRPDTQPEDIRCLDLERNIVTTAYGTVEYRVLCAQPFDEAFAPSAFNYGLRVKLEQTLALARDFDARFGLPAPDERNHLASRGVPAFAPKQAILDYAACLLALSREGLRSRGHGEEKLLLPLERREKLTDSPAARLLRDERLHGAHAALMKRAEIGETLRR